MTVETVKVPDIGGAEGVEVIEICVSVGDHVEQEDSLVVLESDKASMEIPSPHAGVVKSITIADGDTLSEGDLILELETTVASSSEPIEEPPVDVSTAAPPKDNSATEESTGTNTSVIETINVPDIGTENADVIEVCVAVGDTIDEGDSLIVLETDKASMEVPSPKSGKVTSIAIKEGDTASEGSAILQMEVALSSHSELPVAETPAVNKPSVPAETHLKTPEVMPALEQTPTKANEKRTVYAGPAVRLLARELGVDVNDVVGTGPRGRITKDDLKAFVKTTITQKTSGVSGAGIPTIPAVDFSQFGEVTLEKMSKIQKITVDNMHRSWLNVPHVTQFDDVDISDLEDFRQTLKVEAEQRGVKITPLPFLLKACANALKEHPKFNASLHSDGEHLVYKHFINIGMAVDTPAGLMVPVIKDVDKKSIWELASETVELAEKAKNRKLKLAEMQGACFTLSSLGGIGGKGFTPIVNTPEVAILGISKLDIKPVWNGAEFVPRKMLPLSLSYDHRAINGGDAGRFFTYLGTVLADIRLLVL